MNPSADLQSEPEERASSASTAKSNGSAASPSDPLAVLTAEERQLLAELQRLFDAGVEEVDDAFAARLRATLRWSDDDPASPERAACFAAHDPYLQREMRAIQRDFAWLDLQDGEQPG
jgi:hypothetical protein